MEENKRSILFLHGFTQNSIIFQNRIKVLINSITKNFKNAKILIPDAPFVIEDNEKSEEIKRGWLYLDESNKSNCTQFEKEKEVVYLGLNESLKSLITLNEQNNFDIECIIGFSQGSLIATFLSILLTKPEFREKFPNVKCVILVSGFIDPIPKNEEINFYYPTIKKLYLDKEFQKETLEEQEKIQIPSLHVYGTSDPYIVPEKSQTLSGLFSNSAVHIHDGKHYLPTKKENIEVYEDFLKKYLCQ